MASTIINIQDTLQLHVGFIMHKFFEQLNARTYYNNINGRRAHKLSVLLANKHYRCF